MNRIIETERLYLRRFVREDAEMIYRLNSDTDVMRYMPAASRRRVDPDSAAEMVRECIAQYERFSGLGIWPTILKASDEPIGWTCLKPLGDTTEIELGYRYFPQHWGKGFATEISKEVVRYGFEDLGLHRIVGITHPENLASRRVLEKVGFGFEGVGHHYGIDVTTYGLDAEDHDVGS